MTVLGMLDTSVLISGLPDDVVDDIDAYRSSMICRGELIQGLVAFRSDQRRQAAAGQRRELIRTLDELPGFWLPFDRAASDSYGALTVEPRSAGRLKDALIAAHAHAVGVPLLTEDEGFTRYPEVDIRLLPQRPWA
ncbi:type II toxin-antitoxin system VapC family toxin [Leifsonia aquatica]|uniref:PIN domain protein n=2 Tax=Leifsonia aquatica TaxID=144185 RepID=U2RMG6_LEIAQ|nr:PIN domain-containing protein [Leifsonia aquatica]ERK70031.1 PIN domain protein [Leifsonia aquatica ATCC 14665]MBB2967074.1 putative nucleic acid-binding protein [Leifsonia aquatica]